MNKTTFKHRWKVGDTLWHVGLFGIDKLKITEIIFKTSYDSPEYLARCRGGKEDWEIYESEENVFDTSKEAKQYQKELINKRELEKKEEKEQEYLSAKRIVDSYTTNI